MELHSFDLLWVSDPFEHCLHDGTRLDVSECEVGLQGPVVREYFLEMASCSECGQWYGLTPILYDVLAEAQWDASDVETFTLEGVPVTTGVYLGPPTIPWSTFRDQSTSLQPTHDRPPPTDEEVRSLEQFPTTWEIDIGPTTWIEGSDDSLELGYVALVHGPQFLRGVEITTGTAPTDDEVAALIRRAALTPLTPSTPHRPRRVRVHDESLAGALKEDLSPLTIDVEVEETPLATEALEEITALLLGDPSPPVFRGADDETVRAFLETATRFYEAEPWKRTEGDRFLGVRLDEGDWFFANVMGQIEESPGLSLFPDWLTVCRFIHSQRWSVHALAQEYLFGDEFVDPSSFAFSVMLEAAGAVEALSLDKRPLLHPADAERLDRLSISPPIRDQYPVPHRFDAVKGPVALQFSLDSYRYTMEALLTALEQRHATPVTSIKTTLDVDGTTVSLRYPSEGTEQPYEGPPGYQLRIYGHDEDILSPSRLPEDTDLVIQASATALFKDIAKVLKRREDQFYEVSLIDLHSMLWNDRTSRRNPSPRVADLVELPELRVEIGGSTFGLIVDRPLDAAPDDISIRRTSR